MRSLYDLQLAKKYHPDTNKSASAAEKFQEISEAYEVKEKTTCYICQLI